MRPACGAIPRTRWGGFRAGILAAHGQNHGTRAVRRDVHRRRACALQHPREQFGRDRQMGGAMPDARAFHDRPDHHHRNQAPRRRRDVSTAFEHPYSMCRRLSSLDHLSGGRVAWNIVSSYSKSEWDAYGHQMTDRSGRYERLEEYMEVCYKLWGLLGARRDHRRQGFGDLCRSVEDQGGPSRRQILQMRRPPLLRALAARTPGALAGRLFRAGRDFAAKHAEAISPFIRTSTG